MNPRTTTAASAASTVTSAPESVPARWSTQDETFFRVVGDLFRPSYLLGATVLLASYDPGPEPA